MWRRRRYWGSPVEAESYRLRTSARSRCLALSAPSCSEEVVYPLVARSQDCESSVFRATANVLVGRTHRASSGRIGRSKEAALMISFLISPPTHTPTRLVARCDRWKTASVTCCSRSAHVVREILWPNGLGQAVFTPMIRLRRECSGPALLFRSSSQT